MGARYRVILDWHDKGLHEWVRLSLPLMAGVSLVTADIWIIAHFASSTNGAISLITYAKRLFTAPMAVLAQAAGAASMPFFASLWAQGKRGEFASSVADSVSRVVCMGFLAASGMVALGVPLVSVLFVGGRFSRADAQHCAAYFAVFSISLFLWSAQSIYSRAFYAAGNTFAPMAAGTIVTVISLPIYAGFYRWYGAMGLAFASDIGIAMQTLAIAGLLHRRQMVSLTSLDYREMVRCLGAALLGGAVTWGIFSWMAEGAAARLHLPMHGRLYELSVLVAGGLMWSGISFWVLKSSGSALPRALMKRMRIA
jgi:putative peptidoglycan lipid II flippase